MRRPGDLEHLYEGDHVCRLVASTDATPDADTQRMQDIDTPGLAESPDKDQPVRTADLASTVLPRVTGRPVHLCKCHEMLCHWVHATSSDMFPPNRLTWGRLFGSNVRPG